MSQVSWSERRSFEQWLTAVDQELENTRAFSPTVAIRFSNRPTIDYSREWALMYLELPDEIDESGEWVYHCPRDHCMRDIPRALTMNLLTTCPSGSTTIRVASGRNVLYSASQAYYRILAECAEHSRKGKPILTLAASFISATQLLVRDNTDNALIDSIL